MFLLKISAFIRTRTIFFSFLNPKIKNFILLRQNTFSDLEHYFFVFYLVLLLCIGNFLPIHSTHFQSTWRGWKHKCINNLLIFFGFLLGYKVFYWLIIYISFAFSIQVLKFFLINPRIKFFFIGIFSITLYYTPY